MRSKPMRCRNRIIAPLLSVLIALAPAQPVPVSVLASVAGVSAVALWPGEAEARASSGGRSSSGGYSRPSSRTPSVTVRPSAPRTPSVGSGGYSSGGYSRPQTAPSPGYSGGAPSGGGDLSVSRRSSSEALDRYRIEQERRRTPPVTAPAPAPAPRNDYGWGSGWGQRRSGGGYAGPGGWYGGWRAPGWATGGSPSFGFWNGVFLWFLLDNLTRPGYADWFHHHQNDPGYAQWRAEAERRAQDDPQLRARLNDLDTRLRAQESQPRDPNYLPPDTPREVARADTPAPSSPAPSQSSDDSGAGGFGTVVIILLLAGVGVVAFMVLRRRATKPGASSMSRTSLGTAANIIRQKVSGKPYEPSLFRVGMTLTLDPTPFVLAGTATKVTPPGGSGGDALVSVEAVGTLKGGGVTLHRLYLQGGRGFFQLHLGADGVPDECRWFSTLDEVQPADSEEWAFWLGDADGMIGYPQFQTKDGKLYDRQWNPSASRIAPVVFDETLADHRGSRTRRVSAMLYAAATGAADPAPATEYVLVAAVEDSGNAWVEVRAGIDINPATLSLT